MTLGQRIQELRKAMGLSQEALGERLELSRQAISKWEADGAVPEVDKLIALSRLFGVSLNELLQVDITSGAPEEEPERPERPEEMEAYLEKARRRRRLRMAGSAAVGVLAVAVVALAAALLARQGALLSRFEDRLSAMERHVAQMKEVPAPALDLNAPLVADVDVSAQLQPNGSYVTMDVTLLPAQSMEGLELTFQISGTEMEPVLAIGERSGNSTEYRATLTYSQWWNSPTLSVIFDDGAVQYTQPLLKKIQANENGYSCEPVWKD